jgi:hypothetical protein
MSLWNEQIICQYCGRIDQSQVGGKHQCNINHTLEEDLIEGFLEQEAKEQNDELSIEEIEEPSIRETYWDL